MKKELLIVLLILISGIYLTCFGIYTLVEHREIYWNGLVILCIGLLSSSLGILGLFEELEPHK